MRCRLNCISQGKIWVRFSRGNCIRGNRGCQGKTLNSIPIPPVQNLTQIFPYPKQIFCGYIQDGMGYVVFTVVIGSGAAAGGDHG